MNNLPDDAIELWYGKHSSTGCKGVGYGEMRYYVCFVWNFMICEKWIQGSFEDYIFKPPKEVHKHLLHYRAIPKGVRWCWDFKSDSCTYKELAQVEVSSVTL